MTYPGPSSLCNSMLLKSAGQVPSMSQAPPISSTFVDVNNNFPRHIVNECVALFFRWQSLHSMLIDREEFLMGYSNGPYAGKHTSTALEQSICAMGALMSSDIRIRGLADSFFAQATRILELESLLNAKEASIQALILCSLYQIGKSDFSKGRTLSGRSTLFCCYHHPTLIDWKALHFAYLKISQNVTSLKDISTDNRVRREKITLDGVRLQTILNPISSP